MFSDYKFTRPYVASLIVRRHKGKINARMQDDKHICFNVFLGCV